MEYQAKTVAIGNDHAAIELKEAFVKEMESMGLKVIDMGCGPGEAVDYPVPAQRVGEAVVSKTADLGIVLCGSGIGISISCNKVDGVRCALCHDHFTAKMCRLHNNANVMSIGARVTGQEVALDCLRTFLTTPFEGGRHERRVNLIHEIEKK